MSSIVLGPAQTVMTPDSLIAERSAETSKLSEVLCDEHRRLFYPLMLPGVAKVKALTLVSWKLTEPVKTGRVLGAGFTETEKD